MSMPMEFTARHRAIRWAVVAVVGVAGCGTDARTADGTAHPVAPDTGNAGRGALVGGTVGLTTGGQTDRRANPPGGDPKPAELSHRAAVDEVVAWTRQGKSSEVIVDRIRRGDVVYRLTPADEDALRAKGVDGNVIRAMRDTARR